MREMRWKRNKKRQGQRTVMRKKMLSTIKSSGSGRETDHMCVQKKEKGHSSLRVKRHKKDGILAPFSFTTIVF